MNALEQVEVEEGDEISFCVAKGRKLKPVVKLVKISTTETFFEGRCECSRCRESGWDESEYQQKHTHEIDGKVFSRRFAESSASDLYSALKAAWKSYMKNDMPVNPNSCLPLYPLEEMLGRDALSFFLLLGSENGLLQVDHERDEVIVNSAVVDV